MSMQLTILDSGLKHIFAIPSKRIHEGQDVPAFLTSQAYRDITIFLVQLNRAMFPVKNTIEGDQRYISPAASQLQALINAINALIDEVPLDPGTHRFGNTAFRKWFALLEEKINRLLEEYVPKVVTEYSHTGEISASTELQAYLLGSFGSAQRLDYGTGHELSFLAFLAGIWKLGGFSQTNHGSEERSIVLDVIEPYLAVVRKLILKYSLEPAGSHGVWGLDDHSFLPYIFGSAQYGPSISDADPTPTEGSSSSAPDPGSIVKSTIVARERQHNLYFGAIGFIYDVKTGPFWEHSPTLFDISGVTAGWAKINKGMLKMYNAEVLSKFPVVQHFPFGSLFSFDRNPEAKDGRESIHTMSQPRTDLPSSESTYGASSTAAPWSKSGSSGMTPTSAPWTRSGTQIGIPTRTVIQAGQSGGRNLPISSNGTLTTGATRNINNQLQERNSITKPA